METLLWSLFVATAVMALVICVLVAFAVRSIRRSIRVVPEMRSEAPLSWQASPRHHARLHRQLQALVASVRTALARSRSELQLRPMARELESHACALDDQLIIAARAPAAARARMLRELDSECRALSEAAQRIIALSVQTDPARSGLAQVSERLDALDAALAELDGAAPPPTPAKPRPQPGRA